ncbi:uncharacterized protein LOC124113272 [Haliotis rufescens]|uniref:uncharacterized protein LOC124113272 n=1 Tax=Haliotis rufescens TaxID=6454 RepID=UPI00201EEFC8|nr:uncharacterized protein LOC124113272 [Haliotis rufescens]XP_048238023.1 uncharacterized protein LOC124113272 [Haliotis rufescens]
MSLLSLYRAVEQVYTECYTLNASVLYTAGHSFLCTDPGNRYIQSVTHSMLLCYIQHVTPFSVQGRGTGIYRVLHTQCFCVIYSMSLLSLYRVGERYIQGVTHSVLLCYIQHVTPFSVQGRGKVYTGCYALSASVLYTACHSFLCTEPGNRYIQSVIHSVLLCYIQHVTPFSVQGRGTGIYRVLHTQCFCVIYSMSLLSLYRAMDQVYTGCYTLSVSVLYTASHSSVQGRGTGIYRVLHTQCFCVIYSMSLLSLYRVGEQVYTGCYTLSACVLYTACHSSVQGRGTGIYRVLHTQCFCVIYSMSLLSLYRVGERYIQGVTHSVLVLYTAYSMSHLSLYRVGERYIHVYECYTLSACVMDNPPQHTDCILDIIVLVLTAIQPALFIIYRAQ